MIRTLGFGIWLAHDKVTIEWNAMSHRARQTDSVDNENWKFSNDGHCRSISLAYVIVFGSILLASWIFSVNFFGTFASTVIQIYGCTKGIFARTLFVCMCFACVHEIPLKQNSKHIVASNERRLPDFTMAHIFWQFEMHNCATVSPNISDSSEHIQTYSNTNQINLNRSTFEAFCVTAAVPMANI